MVAVAVAWTLFVLGGIMMRVAAGDPRPTNDLSDAASERYRTERADRQMIDGILLVGGAVALAIAGGVAHRVRSSVHGSAGRSATSRRRELAFVGMMGFVVRLRTVAPL